MANASQLLEGMNSLLERFCSNIPPEQGQIQVEEQKRFLKSAAEFVRSRNFETNLNLEPLWRKNDRGMLFYFCL